MNGSTSLVFPKVGWTNDSLVKVIPVEEYAGEFRKASVFNMFALWFVSVLALVTNLLTISVVWGWRYIVKKDPSFNSALWAVGRSPKHFSSPFVDWFSDLNHKAKVFAAGCLALDIFYNFNEKYKPKLRGNVSGWFTRYWIGRMQNRQAVSNRRKIVSKILAETFGKFAGESEIRLVSIASGSAQAVIDAILSVPHLNVRVKLIDVDKAAIEASRERIRQAGLEDRMEVIRGTTKALERVCRDFSPHVVEMVGFLDYRPDDKAAQLIERIKRQMVPGGFFLTCNIKNNPEKIFLDWVLLWPMIYRSPEDFFELLAEGGFDRDDIGLFSCPFGIHTLAVCRNGSRS